MDKQKCTTCGRRKLLSQFHRKGIGYRRKCKECQAAYSKDHYEKNKPTRLKQIAQNVTRFREKWLGVIQEMKNTPCMDCKQSFPPFVMDFDHRDGTTKLDNVANLVGRRNVSIKRLMEEIKKCDVVCANCHRIRTHHRKHPLLAQW